LVELGITEEEASDSAAAVAKTLNRIRNDRMLKHQIEAIRNFNATLRDTFCGVCFSEVMYDDHMWNEYASESSGFCVEYTFPRKHEYSSDQTDLIMNLLPMYYGEKEIISVLDLIASSVEASRGDYYDMTKHFFVKTLMNLCTKKIDWSTQYEWRLWERFSDLKSRNVKFPFASTVYLGRNMNVDHRSRMIDAAQKKGLRVFQQTIDTLSSRTMYCEVKL
jgi:hypothetical protein